MKRNLMMCVACILMLGLCVPNATAGEPSPRTSTDGSIGRIHGDFAAAGLAGVQKASVDWGDYNDDGNLDLVLTAGSGADYVTRVYRNLGASVFSAAAECVTANGVTTCEGDQSAGVLIPSTTPTDLWVGNLTGDIAPADSVSGIDASVTGGGAQDGPNLEIQFVGGGHAILTHGDGAHGISATTSGLTGYRGGDDYGGFNPFYPVSYGGNGGTGHAGGGISVTNDGDISTQGKNSHGIFAWSQGGTGGHGGHAGAIAYARGGNGGTGGLGDTITVINSGAIETQDSGSHGIFVVSRGGTGGGGGDAGATVAEGGNGGGGGRGGNVTVTNEGTITTMGVESNGILAQGLGGTGGGGGVGGGLVGGGGGANPSGTGGVVDVYNSATVTTGGVGSNGVLAQSIGGFGGSGGGGGGFVSWGGVGATGGNGDSVRIANSGSITTAESDARGLMAQSIGGGGGNSSASGGVISIGGSGNAGGHGGYAAISNSGAIATEGDYSDGILIQSIGGGGGNGAGSGGLFAVGGSGSSTGDGALVEVDNSGAITTAGDNSHAIMAQSIGGGGGNGAGSGGVVSIGGSGNAGGSGGDVVVANSSMLVTEGVSAGAIFAQSIGGGGGNGGSAGGIAAFGGSGSVTSDGGNVLVANSGTIMTGTETPDEDRPQSTSGSHAIFAQSIGGGGGNGGSSAGWFTIGGNGGGGGDAGAVGVDNMGSLSTQDDNSSAIFAQSVGGGGGNGGGVSSSSPTLASVAIGGSGAGGGDGDTVTVTTSSGSVTTQGNNAHGILAQSVGGGGGNGGFAVSTTGGTTPVRVSIGGSAGPGGDGGIVNVISGSNISTSGVDAHGIAAQSIGGGGGTGGFAIAANYAGGMSINVAVGGSGGSGGDGEVVTVGTDSERLAGTITTSGDRSSGVLAQSIGGGGGNGGFAVTGALLSTATIGVALGGSGGVGGVGESVQVVGDADIGTTGDAAHGILAQSIGGGGGAGGWSLSAGVTAFGGATVSLGGEGGSGSKGGTVDVESGGTIVTEGDFSHGVMAQSIGGGGGTGGMSGSAMVNFSGLIPLPPEIPVSVSANFAVAIGGDGGSGGSADSVSVTNTGNIGTSGDFSQGIVAQSIGGGGGAGGQSIAATANIGVTTPDDFMSASISVDFALAIGGEGGSGNHGGAVDVNQEGRIETVGDGSHGILAQSIGGGGGIGGSARALTVGIDPSEWGGAEYATPEISQTVNIGIGGNGGSGSNGEAVTVTNSGDITTFGADAHGIIGQSIGGGGGLGGGGYHGIDWDDLGLPDELISEFISESGPNDFQEIEVVVGGSGGSSGDGSVVDIYNSGSILTLADGSFGILAQSIGAGGGTGGVGAQGSGDVGVGGGGGSSGDGGDVTIESDGDIETVGSAAHALIAQSIGGGGGIAGNVDRGIEDFGINLAIGQNGGSAGDGGTISVDVGGHIVTHGSGSNGIFAQSVGGGGGLAGDLGFGIGFAGSAGGDGSGGDVYVNLEGSITTYGDASHGIVAQSAGGANDFLATTSTILQDGGARISRSDRVDRTTHLASAGSKSPEKKATGSALKDGATEMLEPTALPTVTMDGAIASSLLPDRADLGRAVAVDVDGDVMAHGENSHGIVAQSVGDDGNGNITIDIISGTVQGGTGSSVGVLMQDGADNVLSNQGFITTLSGALGMAVQATAGNETIENLGWITGSVDLGGGTNYFNNRVDATFASGSIVNLGAGGVMTNDGVFSPGGAAETITTTFTGGYVQTASGIFEATVCGTEHDLLLLGGQSSANLDGTLRVVADADAYIDGTTYDIIQAQDPQQITGAFSDIDLPETAFLDFDWENVGGNLRLSVDVESFERSATNPLEKVLAKFLDECMPDANNEMSRLLGAFQLSSAEQVAEAFQSLSPDSYGNLTDGSAQSVRLNQDVLAQRLDAARSNPYTGDAPMAMAFKDGNGWWLSGALQGAGQDATDGYLAHNVNVSSVQGGYERFFGGSVLGGAISAARTDVDRDNETATGTMDGVAGSIYGAHLWGKTFAQGVFSYEGQSFENQREIVVGTEERTAKGTYNGSALSALATAGMRFVPGAWGLEPFASLRYAQLSQDGFTEEGAGGMNLIVEQRSTDWLGSDLGIRLNRAFASERTAFVPELLLAWNHDFSIDNREVNAAFVADPTQTFTIEGQNLNGEGATLGAGLTFSTASGWKASVRYDRLQRSDFHTDRLSFRLGSSF